MVYDKDKISKKQFIVKDALFSYQFLLIENGFSLEKIILIEQMMDDFDMRPFVVGDVQKYMSCDKAKAEKFIRRLESIGIVEKIYGYKEKSYRFKSVFF